MGREVKGIVAVGAGSDEASEIEITITVSIY